MNFKEGLKNFFRPEWKKIILVFILEFTLTFVSLAFQLSDWQVFLISPNALYLESVINPLTVTQFQFAFHMAVSNLIALVYLYFLSCALIRISKIGRFK